MLKLGVIGIGSMGQNHARVYSELNCLNGITDIDEESAKKVANRFNVEHFSDYKELIKNVSAVSIATPTETHYEIALNCLKNGKHCIVEKPITDDEKKAEKLIETAEKQGLTLAVGHIERHNPVVRFAKHYLKDKKLISISSKRVSSLPFRIKDVGVILDLGIHDIDVMRYLAGKVKSVYTLAGKIKNDKYEDYANILLNFENGTVGFIETNWLTPMKVRKLSLTCEEIFAEIDYINQEIQLSSSSIAEYNIADLSKNPWEFHIQKISLKKEEPLKNELKDFIESIEKKRTPLVSGKDGLETLKVSNCAVKSYKEKKIITFE